MLLLEDNLTKFAKALDIPLELGMDLDNGSEDQILDFVDGQLFSAGFRNYATDCGVTKIVVIPGNSAFVLKTPIYGEEIYNEVYDEAYGDYYFDWDNPIFERYTGAVLENEPDLDCGDYCEKEALLYKIAEEEGVAEMFAKTEYFCETKNCRPIYISEKCSSYFGEDRQATEKSKTLVKEALSNNTPGWARMGDNIMGIFIDDYGYEKVSQLMNFLVKYKIFDLHSNNIMYSERTGKIVISDYSDFCH